MKIIAFEGTDGSGKSTSAQLAADVLGYALVKTPSKRFREMRAQYDTGKVPVPERFSFYAAGLADSVEEILRASQHSSGVVVDRYTLSLGLYHEAMDSSIPYANIAQMLGFPQPAFHVILRPPFEVIQQRILARYDGRSDTHIEQNFGFIRKVYDMYSQCSGRNIVFIDTHSATPQEVVSTCSSLLQ